MSGWWWTPSRDAKLLALGLARQAPPPVSTFDTIQAKFAAFESTYLNLLELLRRDDKSVDVLDALTHPPLSQTLDEYEDFKFDADALQRGGSRSFSKRDLDIPFLSYQVARYVYTDADIKNLIRKIDIQIRIMDAKMDDMVVTYFLHVYKRSQVRSSHDDQGSGLLASTLRPSRDQYSFGPTHPQDDDDKNIVHLWDRVDRLSNRLIRTSPHVQSRIDSKHPPPRLSLEEVNRVVRPLKARLERNAISESAGFSESWAEDKLAEYSQHTLRSLLNSFPSFTTRKRVYSKDELMHSRNITLARSIATMDIQPTRFEFNLMTLDIVSFQRRRVIVCTDEYNTFGAVHYLPQRSVIYPSTDTRWVDPANHDTKACFGEECLVQLTGSENYSEQKALALYSFPLRSDLFAFQSALRGKLIRHASDVDYIKSKRGTETNHQQLKIWSDLNDENYTLSFYFKKGSGYETYLEFPLECFVPKPTKNQDKSKPELVRLYFRLPPETPKARRPSRVLFARTPSPSEAKIPKGITPFFKSRHNSTEISPTKSIFERFSKTRQAPETTLSLSPPTGRINQRSSSSSGSISTQSTDNTAAESAVSASSAMSPNIHPDAKAMQHFDFKFSNSSDAEFFTKEFTRAVQKRPNRHLRGDSIYDGSRHRASVSMADSMKSPNTLDKENQVVAELQELPLPSPMIPFTEKEMGILVRDDSGSEDHDIPPQIFEFEDEQPGTNDSKSKPEPISPDRVYRMRGIPTGCQVDDLKSYMASKFDIDPSEIDVRSLAIDLDRKSQTAIVMFDSVPFAISSKEDNWDFRWKVIKSRNASHIQIDTHFNGLTMLYSPPENVKHELDIFAVAGLGENAFEAFEEKGNGVSYMWVLDLLQHYFPGARIMLFGFSANLSIKRQSRVLQSLATELIDSMDNLDDDRESEDPQLSYDNDVSAPLIFIGYSLAGLVIKKAMVIAAEQPEDNTFYKSVYGALLFGVPSTAMETTALHMVLRYQAGLFKVVSDWNVVQALNDKFDSVIKDRDLHMQYFYETEKTLRSKKVGINPHVQGHKSPRIPSKNMQNQNGSQRSMSTNPILVVNQSSATNTRATDQSMEHPKNVHSIQRDHLNLVKWRAHDPECAMVIRVMKTMKTKALAKHRDQPENFSRPAVLSDFRTSSAYSISPRMESVIQQLSKTTIEPLPLQVIPSENRATGLSTKDYHVGWICAVGPEYVAALQLLDKKLSRPLDLSEDDENAYSFGRMGAHYVVIAGLAEGKYGLTSAASAATDMKRSFQIRIGLMVGIAGGAPSKKHDIRLGDVVVSTPKGQRGGVFRYDSGKTIQNKEFVITGSLNSPPDFLLKALTMLSSLHRGDGHMIKTSIENMLERKPRLRSEYSKPDLNTDILYKSSFVHPDNNKSCAESCFPHKDCIEPRPPRDLTLDDPVVHFGLIASGDQLMKDASVRDALVEKEEVLCFEMEAAGLMDRFPCLVIRGICDYSDTHKNDLWQGYAAATAAAYAKELLLRGLPGRRILEDEGATASNYETEEDSS